MEHHKTRTPMPLSRRAKQFMPFAAVKGLEEAIAAKERELAQTDRIEFGEEQRDKINRILCRLKKGDCVCLTWYSDGTRQYYTVQGIVREIIPERSLLRLGEDSIPFEAIADISITQ